MKSGRNEPCPCGSGEKYKRCCGVKALDKQSVRSRFQIAAAAIVVTGAAAAALWFNFGQTPETDALQVSPVTAQALPAQLPAPGAAAVPGVPATAQPTPFQPAAQPPGAAPAGKVWSVEHGHWHDVATTSPIQVQSSLPMGGTGNAPTAIVTPMATAPATEPQVAPDGKVWSVDHGHWHDVEKDGRISDVRVFGRPVDQYGAKGGIPQPPGDVPPGKVWSSEHGHWHDTADGGAAADAQKK